MHAWVDRFEFRMQIFFSNLDVGACTFHENVPIEIFNMSFESKQNKQQYGNTIICTEVRGKSYGDKKCDTTFFCLRF